MDTIPIPLYYKDVKGNYQGCNRSFEKWFGIHRVDIIGKGDDLFYPGRSPLFDATDMQLLENLSFDLDFADLPQAGADILAGKIRGRAIIKIPE